MCFFLSLSMRYEKCSEWKTFSCHAKTIAAIPANETGFIEKSSTLIEFRVENLCWWTWYLALPFHSIRADRWLLAFFYPISGEKWVMLTGNAQNIQGRHTFSTSTHHTKLPELFNPIPDDHIIRHMKRYKLCGCVSMWIARFIWKISKFKRFQMLPFP